MFEVRDECGGWLVGIAALAGELLGDRDMLVPAAVEELDETHAAFRKAAGEQAVRGIGAGLAGLGTVEFEGGSGLVGEIGELGDGGLHAEGHFVGMDAGNGLGIAHFIGEALVEGVPDEDFELYEDGSLTDICEWDYSLAEGSTVLMNRVTGESLAAGNTHPYDIVYASNVMEAMKSSGEHSPACERGRALYPSRDSR